MLDERTKKLRRELMPVVIIEHHKMFNPNLSTYDICDLLGGVWEEIEKEAEFKKSNFSAEYILEINNRLCSSLNMSPGTFENAEKWDDFVDSCGCVEEDPDHVLNWIFSSLYWTRLTKLRLATSWIFINGIRIQYGFPKLIMPIENIGRFLDSLSGSGPPIYDGQTFYIETYCET